MTLKSISPEITTRFLEVQDLLAFIRQHESKEIGTSDPNAVIIMRGLFYVHLYGAFEYSINRIVLGAVQEINQASLPHSKVIHSLGVLVLDGAFESLYQSGRDTKWDKRFKLIQLRLSDTVAKIHDGCIDLQNIWLDTITEIFKVFGINRPIMYDITKQGYIRELVGNRNPVSHGRESPLTVGKKCHSSHLEKLYEAIRTQAFYILDCFSEYIAAREFEIVL